MEELNNQTTGNLFTDPSHPLHFSPYFLLLPLLAYPVLVALLRHHRLRTTLEDYPYTTRRSYASMTSEDAFYIQQRLGELEFPFIFEKALQFALFRTYGIPTISKLLVQTSQFSEQATASKRYADTSVLIAEFAGYHPKSPRAIEAIGRMNFIHSHYQRSGKILDDDMLYTLSLFALEPIRWIARYEWRELDEFEKAAVGTFWKGVGDAMGVKFDKLKGGGKGGGWTDGLQWLEEVEEWAQAYEKRCMVPDENNRKTAEQTVTILLWTVPQFLKPYGKKIVSVLMDDRLRKAMIYEKPSRMYFILVSAMLTLRKYALRYLFLPRLSFLSVHNTTYSPSKDGTYFMKVYEMAPWYVKPTLWNRFGPSSWISRLRGLPLPGDEGDKYWPKGYRLQDIGPDIMSGKGAEYAKESKERLVKMSAVGCPFGRVKAE